MSEIPDDILREAERITKMDWYEGDVRGEVARALLAERLSATERAAKIAEAVPDAPFSLHGKWNGNVRATIAAAIRSQP